MKRAPNRIVLAVTSAQSMRLLTGFPEYLSGNGWDTHVICSHPPAGHNNSSYKIHNLPMRRDPSPAADLLSLARWIYLLVRLRPGIVVAGTPKAGLLGMLAAAVTLVPTRVYMLRGLRLSTEIGLRRQLLRLIERLTVGASTHVQAVSFSLRDEFLDEGIATVDKVFVVGQGSSNGVVVPEDISTRSAPGTARLRLGLPDLPTVGYVGRLHPDKGLRTLMDALALSNGPIEWQAVLVGPEDRPDYLRGLLEDLSPAQRQRIVHVGVKADPSEYYAAMDVLALPTLREGFPNVVLEAAAHGTPTVASDVTGCRDAVVDGVTGLLATPQDAADLSRKIEHLLADHLMREQLGQKALERVRADFRRQDIWRQTEHFYSSLYPNRRSGV